MAEDLNAQLDAATERLLSAQAQTMAHLASLGRTLAEREGYGSLKGLDAIHRFLIEKYRWLPRDVRALTHDETMLLLEGVDLEKPKKKPVVVR